jgi:hypothetical protein
MVRVKFQLVEIREFHWNTGKRLIFQPQYDATIPEEQRFAQATPTGTFEMMVDNPAALAQFTKGGSYYFDVSPSPVVTPDPVVTLPAGASGAGAITS